MLVSFPVSVMEARQRPGRSWSVFAKAYHDGRRLQEISDWSRERSPEWRKLFCRLKALALFSSFNLIFVFFSLAPFFFGSSEKRVDRNAAKRFIDTEKEEG